LHGDASQVKNEKDGAPGIMGGAFRVGPNAVNLAETPCLCILDSRLPWQIACHSCRACIGMVSPTSIIEMPIKLHYATI